MKFSISAVLALVALARSAAVDLKDNVSPLNVHLTRLSNTKVKAAVINSDTKGYNLRHRGTILDSGPVRKVHVTSKASSPNFNGILLRLATSSLSDDAFVPIAAGETLEVELDIAEIYDVSTSDKYDVVATGAFHYAETGSTELTGHVLEYASNRLSLDVDGDEAAKVVEAVSHARMQQRSVWKNDCPADKTTPLWNGYWYCKYYARIARGDALHGDGSKFKEYFKTTDLSVRKHVANRMSAIEQECSTTDSGATTTHCKDIYDACDKSTLAYTVFSTNDVVYCKLFFTSEPDISKKCHAQDRGSTILHEMTHAPGVYSPGTHDIAYGYKASTALSSKKALANADSYALYAQALYAGIYNPC